VPAPPAQGRALRWPRAPSGEYVPADQLPGEVVAAGDAGVHAEALRALAWGGARGPSPG